MGTLLKSIVVYPVMTPVEKAPQQRSYFAYYTSLSLLGKPGIPSVNNLNSSYTVSTAFTRDDYPTSCIRAITLHLREVYIHAIGMIYIGLDEVNYLLDSDYDGEGTQRGFSNDTIIALGGAMLMPDEFVVTIIAGTTLLPIDIVSQQSGLQIQLLPINLLNSDQCDTIVDRMALSIGYLI